MKYCLILSIALSLFSSFKIDKTGPWIESRKNNIFLYTRPINHSDSPSPDSPNIQKILNSQVLDYEYINTSLKTNFTDQVKIYLYNKDEAKARIGTNTGGGAKTKIREIYFAYDTAWMHKNDDFMGNHELTHIIATNSLGFPETLLMNEGYANALSNVYGGRPLVEYVSYRVKRGEVLTATELLNAKRGQYKENLFYPQVGYFINWLIDSYGIEIVNKLYPLKARQIRKKIFILTGKEFREIEKDYQTHLAKLLPVNL